MDKSYYDKDFEEVLRESDTKGIYKKGEPIEGKKKGGLVRFKKQYQMHNGKF